MTHPEEQFWVAQTQQDPTKFDTLYRQFVEEIYRFIYYKTNSREVTEDLTAQVFIQALEHINQFRYRPGARFSSWLYTIARNQVTDYYRKRHETVELDAAEPLASPATAVEHVDQRLAQQRVQEILSQLGESDQEVLRLRLWQDKSYSEMAKILHSNAVAMRARYSRALKKFNTLYTNRYGSTN